MVDLLDINSMPTMTATRAERELVNIREKERKTRTGNRNLRFFGLIFDKRMRIGKISRSAR
jgi:hypothetical protein